MRLTTWNCNGAFHKKMGAVLSLKPDILIVPECARNATAQPELGFAQPNCIDWVGCIPTKGLGVFSFGDYTLSRADFYNPKHRFILPLEIQGPLSFLLLAVWTVPDEGSYVRPLVEAWQEYEPRIGQRDIVVAGDLNASVVIPGKTHYPFSSWISLLERRKVRSLYHEFSRERHGKEKLPTFFMHRNREHPHHIDYIFAGARMISRLESFNIGSHQEWSHYSDHVPLTASFKISG